MDPQSHETPPSFELPSPGQEQGNAPQLSEQASNAPVGETQGAAAVEQGISTPADPAQAQAFAAPQAQPPADPGAAAVAPAADASAVAGWMPQIADDTDLIEKEWVQKAKEIVAQTAHDPHLQNKEMNKVKVDYLKKRYNKDLKLEE